MTYVLNTYHIKRNSVHVAGFSEGAFTWGRYLCYKNPVNPEGPMSTVTSAVFLQGQADACCMSGFPTSDNWGYAGYGIWAQKYNGKFFGLEGTTDGRNVWLPRDTIANRGYGANAYFSYEKLGGGAHCCWNQMYDPNAKDWRCVAPITNTTVIASQTNHLNSMGSYTGGSIFEWMFRQGDTSLIAGIDTPAVNQPPTAYTSNDTTIYVPADSVYLSGYGTDTDGTVISYAWAKSSGPAATIVSPSATATAITGLSTGTYIFRFTVTDDDGATGYDSVTVIVADTSTNITIKKVNVNVYGGTNPYNNPAWNNWNNNASSTITNLLYEDGTPSGYSATQTLTNGGTAVTTPSGDNGATYGGTMCPPEVLRYASYITVGRYLTISGLDTNKVYTISLFASRKNNGNNTNFTINGNTINIITDTNLTNAATFTNLTPNTGGTIVVSITRGVGGTYTYLNGFVIEETDTTSLLQTGSSIITQRAMPDEPAATVPTLKVFPNPAPEQMNLLLTNKLSGPVTLTLTTPSGLIVKTIRLQKMGTQLSMQLNLSNLAKGIYLLKASMPGYTEVKQIVKM
jgi:hypothetical protein